MTDGPQNTKTPSIAIDFGASNGAATYATPISFGERADRVRRSGSRPPPARARTAPTGAARVGRDHRRLRAGRPDRGDLRRAGQPRADRPRRLDARAAS